MKKLILSLFVGFVLIISFCSADFIFSVPSADFNPSGYYVFNHKENINMQPGDLKCSSALGLGCYYYTPVNSDDGVPMDVDTYYCFDDYYAIDCPGVGVNFITFTQPDWNTPFMTSLECQTEYNLIPVEDVDINYCVGNGLCPNECGSGTDLSGDLQYSNIYINSILHPGEENIFIDIPDYIQWDYSVDTGNFNIYVGSGYDMDYMNSIIKINSYRPTSSDFTNIFVSGLTLIFPYIFVLLLIVFIWKLIKRIFK